MLFDPADYPSPDDPKEPKRRRPRKTHTPTVLASDGRWHVIATAQGPVPHCHRIDWVNTTRLRGEGSVVCRCELIGRILYDPEPGTLIYPCPSCWERAG